jgi:hypothetical protein
LEFLPMILNSGANPMTVYGGNQEPIDNAGVGCPPRNWRAASCFIRATRRQLAGSRRGSRRLALGILTEQAPLRALLEDDDGNHRTNGMAATAEWA